METIKLEDMLVFISTNNLTTMWYMLCSGLSMGYIDIWCGMGGEGSNQGRSTHFVA